MAASRFGFFMAFAIAAGLRLSMVAVSPGNYDTDSYDQVVALLREGGELYRDTNRYNYSPAWSLILVFVYRVSNSLVLDPRVVVSLVLLLVDGMTAMALYRIGSRRDGPRRGLSAALLFFLNPVSIWISSAHGQFDGLSIFFLVMAVFFASRETPQPSPTVVCLSLSLIVKHITWFHPVLFALKGKLGRRALLIGLVPYFALGLTFLPYLPVYREVRADVFEYRGLRRLYGFDALLSTLSGAPPWLPTALFLSAVVGAVVVLRRVEIARASLILFLVVLVFAPGIGRQYFVWPIALGSLFGGPGYFVYTLVETASIVKIASLPGDYEFGRNWVYPWLAAVSWLAWELGRLAWTRRDVLSYDVLESSYSAPTPPSP
jgi:Gpi18-like mannosyltransferase